MIDEYTQDLEKTGRHLFPLYLGLLVVAPIPLGANRPWAWSILSLIAFLMITYYCLNYARGKVRQPEFSLSVKISTACLLLWIMYQVLLILPLPIQLVEWLSPERIGMLYSNSFEAYNASASSLSFDRSLALNEIIKNIFYVCMFLFTLLLVNSKNRLRGLLITLVVAGVIQSAWGFTLALHEQGGISNGMESAIRGTFVNKNHFGGFMNMCIAAVIGLMIAVGVREKRRIHRDNVPHHWQSRLLDWRVYLMFYAGIMVVALLFSQSRGAWFSFFMMMLTGALLLSILHIRIVNFVKENKLPFIVLLIMVVIAGVDTMLNRVEDINQDIVLRQDIWNNSLAIFKDFWLTGVGGGNYKLIYPLYHDGLMEKAVYHAHNDYLELVTEQGVIGFGLIGMAILIAFKNAWNYMRKNHPIRKKAYAIASVMAMTSMLVHAFLDFNFQITSNALLFFVFMGIATLQRSAAIHSERRDIAWDDEVFAKNGQ